MLLHQLKFRDSDLSVHFNASVFICCSKSSSISSHLPWEIIQHMIKQSLKAESRATFTFMCVLCRVKHTANKTLNQYFYIFSSKTTLKQDNLAFLLSFQHFMHKPYLFCFQFIFKLIQDIFFENKY